MRPLYENQNNNLEIFSRRSRHIPPHLHNSLECVYVTQGTLEVGIASQLYHMEKGDFAIIFPDLIHHYQVFDTQPCRGLYLLCAPSLAGPFSHKFSTCCPDNPVVKAKDIHEEIPHALKALIRVNDEVFTHQSIDLSTTLNQAYLQIILARLSPYITLAERDIFESSDRVYQAVCYMAKHFQDEITLTSMARDLCVSPYALSRIFSNVFHTNFNKYINEMRLDCACNLLNYSDKTITDIYGEAGFESQRTFNRVFKERYHMSPREYRNSFTESDMEE